MIGKTLAHYEITGLLGKGGMGEVYLARDSRLDRNVAIKVLPEVLSEDRDRLHRFELEARAASALNHPNIVTVYDVGRDHSVSFIALEFVEGKTLREMLQRGPLSLRATLSIGAQVADGLAKAHAAGIVHRDLKPENIVPKIRSSSTRPPATKPCSVRRAMPSISSSGRCPRATRTSNTSGVTRISRACGTIRGTWHS